MGAARYAAEYEGSFEMATGALWKPEWIDSTRVNRYPDLVRIVVGVDPSSTSHSGSAEWGIVVAGVDVRRHGYVLDDKSQIATPDEAMKAAIDAYYRYRADRIVAETNQGGEMVETILRQIDPDVAYSPVWASRGKHTRAEPVSALYEQSRIHHVGMLTALERELTTWTIGAKSPNRLDALVWALTHLLLDGGEDVPYAVTHTHAVSPAQAMMAGIASRQAAWIEPEPDEISEQEWQQREAARRRIGNFLNGVHVRRW